MLSRKYGIGKFSTVCQKLHYILIKLQYYILETSGFELKQLQQYSIT
jgi:hypothetical protein